MFDERKTAQMAAYFLIRRGGSMSHLKLIKLLYLADREALSRFDAPISGDKASALPHGPILSKTLDLMNGFVRSVQSGWDDWIADRENHEVRLNRGGASIEELDELSPADIEVLDAVWQQFGRMSRWELRDYTHQHCREWKDPAGTSKPITVEEILVALGKRPEQARSVEQQLQREDNFKKLFA